MTSRFDHKSTKKFIRCHMGVWVCFVCVRALEFFDCYQSNKNANMYIEKNWQKTTYLLYGPNWIQAAIQYKSQIWLDSVLLTMQSPQYSSSIFLFDLRCFIETLHSMEQSKHRKRTETHTNTWNKLILPAVLKLMEQMCRFSAVYMYNSNLHFNSTPNGCMMVC